MQTQTNTILPADIIELLVIEGFEAAVDQIININESSIKLIHDVNKFGSAMGVFENQISEAEKSGLSITEDE